MKQTTAVGLDKRRVRQLRRAMLRARVERRLAALRYRLKLYLLGFRG